MFFSSKPYYSACPPNQLFNKKRKRDTHEDEEINEENKKIDLSKLIEMNSSSLSGISRHKNHIYFYDNVTTENCLELNRELINLTKELQCHSLEYDCSTPKIYLHINSYGGELLACFSTVDYIKNSPIPIVSIVEGCAASAATLISVVAQERYMTPSSWMLIHQLRGGCWGKFDEMEEDLGNSKKFMEKIYEIYEGHTNLKRKELKKILKKDEWWDWEVCLKYGLIDGINDGWKMNRVVKRAKKSGPVVVEESIEKKVRELVEGRKKVKRDGEREKKREKKRRNKKEKKKNDRKGPMNYLGVVTRSIASKLGLVV